MSHQGLVCHQDHSVRHRSQFHRTPIAIPASSVLRQVKQELCRDVSPCRRDARERRHRTSSGQFSRLLQQHVPCSQKDWRFSAHHQSEYSESQCSEGEIQDGDPEGYTESSPPRRVGYLHRSQGCLLLRTCQACCQEVSPLFSRRPDLPVQGSSVRSHLCPSTQSPRLWVPFFIDSPSTFICIWTIGCFEQSHTNSASFIPSRLSTSLLDWASSSTNRSRSWFPLRSF